MEKITMPSAESRSADLVNENLELLKQIFPEVIKEGRVDLEALHDLLGSYADTAEERFGLNWAGKANARREAQKRSTGTLRPCPEESVDWDTTENLYIEGDNLEVLKLLQKSYHKQVKMIYIDPPYNTGKDFVYKDNYNDNLSNYLEQTGQDRRMSTKALSDSDGRYHSNWLNMMYPRLKLARNLLTDDGVIFISIDDNEVDNLRKICNEIFGEENFIGTIALQTATDNNPGQIKVEHEYMHCYCKNKQLQSHWFGDLEKTKLIQNKYIQLKSLYHLDCEKMQEGLRRWIKANEKDLKGITHYDNVDEKGVFHDGDIANTIFGGYEYDIIHPLTGRICKMPEKGYRFPEETMNKMLLENNILFGKDETTLPKPKKRLEDAKDMLRSMIYEDGRASTKRFETLMTRDIFQNPKSETIISRLVNFICNPNDIILDFFSGSGTTAEAVLLSASKKIGIKYILVQLPENLDTSLINADNKAKKTIKNSILFLDTINRPHIITEIAKERIRRAGKKILEEQKAKNDGLFAEEAPKLDVGFKVFKLDSSNVNAWDSNPENLETALNNSLFNIKEDRTEDDLLYEILIKYGIELTEKINRHTIAGKTVYEMGAGSLIVCLADNITTDVAEGIGKLWNEVRPEDENVKCRMVFKDSGFNGSDEMKTNTMLTLKQHGITNIASV